MIETKDLSYKFPLASENVLSDVNLKVEKGDMVALMGANGSGKTTLTRCLNGLVQPTGGSVTIDGHPVTLENVRTIRRRVGMIFQDPNTAITSPTVEREIAFGLQNLSVPRRVMREKTDMVLEQFHLENLRHVSPMDLSGGEKQRLAIAAVMVLEPMYLVLDEATSFLPSSSRNEVLALVDQLRKELEVGVLLVTQFPEEALRANLLLILHEGRVVERGKPEAIFCKAEVMEGYGIPVPLEYRLGIVGAN